jgi:hydrogenase maturation protein HypF
VSIHVEGPTSRVELFCGRLAACLPARAVLESIDRDDCQPLGEPGFRIVPSSTDGPPRAHVPPDVAVCRECLSDVAAPDNRRHGYVFTTCSGCGPRYSIVQRMPYDRTATGMSRFAMCPRCRAEYTSHADRRFHSQTNCCDDCGPRVWLSGCFKTAGDCPSFAESSRQNGTVPFSHAVLKRPAGGGSNRVITQDDGAIQSAAAALRRGAILALRGLGGYQLLVDATSESAVRELRRRKRRHARPLAVMVADHAEADSLAAIDTIERQALCDPVNPIVVLRRRAGTRLASAVCSSFDTVGLMLPTTALHDRLARAAGCPLVVTSGNLEGEPLEFDAARSERVFSGLADVWLHHDRPILRPIDDSVVRVVAGRVATARLARGLAPLPLTVDTRHRIVALGAHQKAAIALANGVQAVLGPHVGDLDSEASRGRYLDHLAAIEELYDFEPQLLVHDEHPDYFTTQWAARQPVATLAVQHHHAHVVAGMIETGWLDREVLGVAWDGTGYGPDGTIWGGEFLVATARAYRRVARLLPFGLPGGEVAVREPWRVAVALVAQAAGLEAAASLAFDGVPGTAPAQVVQVVQRPHLCPRTSSAGRLFDAVAALALNTAHAQFEGEPAMLLEGACDRSAEGRYELPYSPGEPGLLDWRPLVRGVLDDRRAGISPPAIAMRFHRALAGGVASVAKQFPRLPIVLGGGCFTNRVLTELVTEVLTSRARQVATPGVIPAGDGGLAAGQLAIAAARLEGGSRLCV